MAHQFVSLLKILSLSILLTVLHIGIGVLLPYPLSLVNSIFIGVSFYLLSKEDISVIWIGVISFLIIELYSITFFGIQLISSIIAIVSISWLYKYAFTNKTWYTAGAITLISILIYRLSFFILNFLANINQKYQFSFIRSVETYIWEIILSTITTILLFFLLSNFLPSLNKREIQSEWFKKI